MRLSHRRELVALVTGASALTLVLTSGPVVASPVVGTLSEAEATKIVQGYLIERAGLITGELPSSALSDADASVSASMRSRLAVEAADLTAVREQLRDTPTGGHRAASVDVAVDRIAAPDAKGYVEAYAVETTRLYFRHVGQGAPQYEAYRIGHRFTFQHSGAGWTIVDTRAELGEGPPPPTQARPAAMSWTDAARQPVTRPTTGRNALKPAAAKADAQAVAKVGGKRAVNKLTEGNGTMGPPYNYGAMYSYALQYWDNYNPYYRDYGNDCTNFISQIMLEGGWDAVSGWPWETDDYSKWWYDLAAAGLTSYSWAGANAWGYFAQVYSQRTAGLAYVDELLITDVLQVDWDHVNDGDGDGVDDLDHTMFVTGRTGTDYYAEEVFLTYHTTDRLNVPFYGWLLPQVIDQDPVWYAHRT